MMLADVTGVAGGFQGLFKDAHHRRVIACPHCTYGYFRCGWDGHVLTARPEDMRGPQPGERLYRLEALRRHSGRPPCRPVYASPAPISFAPWEEVRQMGRVVTHGEWSSGRGVVRYPAGSDVPCTPEEVALCEQAPLLVALR